MTAATAPALAPAAELEQALGCPFDPDTGMSLARGVQADELEAVPTEAFAAAWAAGCHEFLVPAEHGGRLTSFEALSAVVRALSRRDLTVSVGLGSTFLAALPVWQHGTDAQCRRVAEIVLNRGFGTAGISEDAAGSDLLATATRAVPTEGGLAVTGRKNLVGNGRRSAFATVLAGSDPSYGLFLLDFAALDPATITRLPKIRTLGLRGHDLSGIEFRGTRVGEHARLGPPGRGIEMVYGMLQITRTLVGAMSLGAADTGLRIALRHARRRTLYGQPALALPPVRALLARGFADVLVAECTQLSAARGLDVAPRRTALWSAVAKYLVPGFCTDALNACGEILSARAYLREGVAGGAFQKLVRDAAITPVFEGTRLVQLETIRAQLASGARRSGDAEVSLRSLFGEDEARRPWSPRDARPSLTYGGADEIVDALDEAADRLADDPPLAAAAHTLVAARNRIREAVRSTAGHRTGAAYDVAREHSLVHAGACCLHTWLSRRDSATGLAADRAWIVLAVQRVLDRLGICAPPDPAAEDRLITWLEDLDDTDRAFSLAALPLAPQFRE